MANFSFLGTGQRDQTFCGSFDPVALDDDLIVALAFRPAARDQLGQVAIPPAVHRQQCQSAERTVLLATGQPDIGATDRFDSGALRRLVELNQRAHVALIRDGHRRHASACH